MFGLFRRGPKPQPQPLEIPATLQMVPVRRSVFEASDENAYGLIQEIITFINRMNDEGKYRGDEIPPLAIQSYHSDYYLAQVNNGGHKQFIHNCMEHYDTTTANARAGLKAMGAYEHLELLEDMAALVAEIGHGDALDQVNEELSLLDDEFFALEKRASMIEKNAAWIRSWLILQVLEDADYSEVVSKTARMNPKRDQRAEMRDMAKLMTKMIDPMQLMIALGLSRCEPPEMISGIKTGSFQTVGDASVMVVQVDTLTGRKLAVVDGDTVRIHEDGQGQIGAMQAQATRDEIEVYGDVSLATNAAFALSFLVDEALGSVDEIFLSPVARVPGESAASARWLVALEGRRDLYLAVFTEDECALAETTDEKRVLATIPKAEIDQRIENIASQL